MTAQTGPFCNIAAPMLSQARGSPHRARVTSAEANPQKDVRTKNARTASVVAEWALIQEEPAPNKAQVPYKADRRDLKSRSPSHHVSATDPTLASTPGSLPCHAPTPKTR